MDVQTNIGPVWPSSSWGWDTRTTWKSMIIGINISTQWEISIDIKIEDVQPQWASVFHVSKGFTGTVGDRIPVKV